MKKTIVLLCSVLICLILISTLQARAKRSISAPKKTYVKKTPYVGFGKKSTANGKIKTERTTGYWKKTGPNRNVTYVSSYSRS